jgi:hypothetical protein
MIDVNYNGLRTHFKTIPVGPAHGRPRDQTPHVPPNPMVTDAPSTITGTLRTPLECFSIS